MEEDKKINITAEDVFGYINTVKNFISENPQVKDAANHVVENGIKTGSYDIVKAAIDGVIDNRKDIDSVQSLGRAALSGLNVFKASPYNDEESIVDCEISENCESFESCDDNEQNDLQKTEDNNNKLSIKKVGGAIAGIKKTSDIIGKTSESIAQLNTNVQSLTGEISALNKNTSGFKNSLAEFKQTLQTPVNAPRAAEFVAEYTDDAAELLNYGVTETAVSTASSTFSKAISSAAKGGIAGAAIGVTMEAVLSYKKMKNGEITKEEYKKEILKSGGQMGISGAATAGITTALSVPIAGIAGAMGVAAAPVTIPISIAVGVGIDKIIAPAFGRGDYKKILDDAKYYSNLMDAHDDLVNAIAMSEQQFADFIDEYQRQTVRHQQLTDTNRQINQLHKVANTKINQQAKQINNTFSSLNDLYNKI